METTFERTIKEIERIIIQLNELEKSLTVIEFDLKVLKDLSE